MRGSVKLDQGYRDIYSITLLGVFLLLCLVKMAEIFSQGQGLSIKGLVLLAIIFTLIGGIYMMGRIRLKMKFGRKKVSVKIAPFGITKMKLKIRDISNVTFFTTGEMTKSSGLFVHFGSRNRIFNFGGSRGMIIELENNRTLTFFSDHLHKQKDEILSRLN